MHRAATLLLALSALLATGATASAQAPDLAAKVAACETGPAAADRFAEFSGSMPREGAAAMAMRFDLHEKRRGGFKPVALENWGVWERTAKEGVPGFIFTKRVEQLASPASFRAVVSFRWYDAKGRVTKTAKRTSAVCRQPDWRPNLRIVRVSFDAERRARATIVNDGRVAVEAFGVSMGVVDNVVALTFPGLPAGQKRTVELGRCRAPEQAVVAVDPAGRIPEAYEADNITTVTCPA